MRVQTTIEYLLLFGFALLLSLIIINAITVVLDVVKDGVGLVKGFRSYTGLSFHG